MDDSFTADNITPGKPWKLLAEISSGIDIEEAITGKKTIKDSTNGAGDKLDQGLPDSEIKIPTEPSKEDVRPHDAITNKDTEMDKNVDHELRSDTKTMSDAILGNKTDLNGDKLEKQGLESEAILGIEVFKNKPQTNESVKKVADKNGQFTADNPVYSAPLQETSKHKRLHTLKNNSGEQVMGGYTFNATPQAENRIKTISLVSMSEDPETGRLKQVRTFVDRSAGLQLGNPIGKAHNMSSHNPSFGVRPVVQRASEREKEAGDTQEKSTGVSDLESEEDSDSDLPSVSSDSSTESEVCVLIHKPKESREIILQRKYICHACFSARAFHSRV